MFSNSVSVFSVCPLLVPAIVTFIVIVYMSILNLNSGNILLLLCVCVYVYVHVPILEKKGD